jgi:hypothetical protein
LIPRCYYKEPSCAVRVTRYAWLLAAPIATA